MSLSRENFGNPVSRRDLLLRLGSGFGSLAVAHLLSQDGLLAGPTVASAGGNAALNGGLHHRAKVKRVVQLFMNGGASPADTFDYKPQLEKLHGKTFDPGGNVKLESVTGSPGFKVLKSPFPFKQHGKSGRWVSSVFPHLAGCVDDLAFLMSMSSKTNVHGPASYMQNTGFVMPGFPSMGAWLSYGLGSLTENLPTFVVIPDARGLPYNNQGDFSAGFLPVKHQGTIIRPNLPNPIADLFPPKSAPFITAESERDGQALLAEANRAYEREWQGDSRLDARIASYALAARMQLTAPAALDLSQETAATRKLYGLDQKPTEGFGRNCLIARRLLERGVRFVQVWSGAAGATDNWDNHGDIKSQLPPMALATDQPCAALVKDLKARGLFEDTLIVWTTEFGRMPFSQGTAGRDHNAGTFVSWLAGAGIKPGVAYGESDEWAWKSRKPTWCYDLHATILHLMGIDHTRLTFRFNGANRRLTDVHGHVIHEVLV
ncbi:MAG TPA: DUF1501 domain-containing protein [Planctomycetaceae bacterium]|jgi:hypothetical protein|nr:DUF1501 domain-containing protein [Planctomycetaceae bacterium]